MRVPPTFEETKTSEKLGLGIQFWEGGREKIYQEAGRRFDIEDMEGTVEGV